MPPDPVNVGRRQVTLKIQGREIKDPKEIQDFLDLVEGGAPAQTVPSPEPLVLPKDFSFSPEAVKKLIEHTQSQYWRTRCSRFAKNARPFTDCLNSRQVRQLAVETVAQALIKDLVDQTSPSKAFAQRLDQLIELCQSIHDQSITIYDRGRKFSDDDFVIDLVEGLSFLIKNSKGSDAYASHLVFLQAYRDFLTGNPEQAEQRLSAISHPNPREAKFLTKVQAALQTKREEQVRQQELEKKREAHQERMVRYLRRNTALVIWEQSLQEWEAFQTDRMKGYFWQGVGAVERSLGTATETPEQSIRNAVKENQKLVDYVRGKCLDEDQTPIQVLAGVVKDGPPAFQKRAQEILAEAQHPVANGEYFLGHIMRYVSEPKTDTQLSHILLQDAEEFAQRYKVHETAEAMVRAVFVLDSNAEIQEKCKSLSRELFGDVSLWKAIYHEAKSIGTEDLYQLILFAGASKVGTLARLATVARAEQAGIVGWKGMALGVGVEASIEGQVIWAGSTLHATMIHDPKKVLSADQVGKTFMANQLMMFGLKPVGAVVGRKLPQVLRQRGYVAADGVQLSLGGKAAQWAGSHGAGFGTMVGTGQLNQWLGYEPPHPAGLNGSVTHSFVSYVKYALGQKALDRGLGKKFAADMQAKRQEIALIEERMFMAGELSKHGFRVVERHEDGNPAVLANGHGLKIRGDFYRYALSRPGFKVEQVLQLVSGNRLIEADIYLQENGLSLAFSNPSNPELLSVTENKPLLDKTYLKKLLQEGDTKQWPRFQFLNLLQEYKLGSADNFEWLLLPCAGSHHFIGNFLRLKSLQVPLGPKVEMARKLSEISEAAYRGVWPIEPVIAFLNEIQMAGVLFAANRVSPPLQELMMGQVIDSFFNREGKLKDKLSPKYFNFFHSDFFSDTLEASDYLGRVPFEKAKEILGRYFAGRLAVPLGDLVKLGLSEAAAVDLILKSGEKFKQYPGNLDFLTQVIRHCGPHWRQGLAYHQKIIESLSKDNAGPVMEFFAQHLPKLAKDGPEKVLQYLDLTSQCFESWPRRGFNIAEGLMEATQKGQFPNGLRSEQENILGFIRWTNSFNPALYKVYQNNPEAFFVHSLGQVRSIVNGTMTQQEASDIVQAEGVDYLLGLFQMASPTAGLSYLNKKALTHHLLLGIKVGDTQQHIPEAWRGLEKDFSLKQGEWVLKAGEPSDAGELQDMMEIWRDGLPAITEDQVLEVLRQYVAGPRGKEAQSKALMAMMAYLGMEPEVLEFIQKVSPEDYMHLLSLEEFLSDKDHAPQRLFGLLEKLPPETFLGKGEKIKVKGNGDRLAKTLRKVWSEKVGGKEMPESKRRELLQDIVKAYDPQQLQDKILNRTDLSDELKGVIQEMMAAGPDLSKKRIINEVFSAPLALIKQQKAKFEYQEGEGIQLGLRAVKSPVHVLHGATSGVCVFDDIRLWMNPDFKLLQIVDKSEQQAVGYIHVFEQEIPGPKGMVKVLTLPGINPTVEFMGQVDAKDLYAALMPQIKAFAQAGGYAAVYIPKSSYIHSNRSDIQKEIERAHYPVLKIPEVQWNHSPEPYPFEEVFVYW